MKTETDQPSHLDRRGVVLGPPHHAGGAVEAGGRLEGDAEVVRLGDVLHAG